MEAGTAEAEVRAVAERDEVLRVIFIGIDPGMEGAIGWMDGERKSIEVHDCPLIVETARGTTLCRETLDFASMDVLIANAMAECRGDGICATVENTISIPHDARGERFLPASDKALHVSLGAWLALLGARHIPTTLVHPKTWKAAMFAGIANSDAAEEIALLRRFGGKELAPKLRGPKGGKRTGRVDAVAICEYGRVAWKLSGRKVA